MSSVEINTERIMSSFANPSRQARPTKTNKPLTRDFFSQLIKLETDFHNKTYSVTTLDELIQFYAKAVEYYDRAKDQISAYFIFKIQDVLATKKSLKMLLDQNAKNTDKRDSNSSVNENNENVETRACSLENKSAPTSKQYVSENILEENSEEEDDREEEFQIKFEKKRQGIRPIRKDRTSISVMKNQKQRFMNFFYKMETQKANEKQNMHVVLNDFAVASDKNDIFAKKDIDNQKNILRKRLQKRTEMFMSHTITHSSQFGNDNHERKENEDILESFLDELDTDQFEDGVAKEGLKDTGSKHILLKENVKSEARIDEQLIDRADFQKREVEASQLYPMFSPKRNFGSFPRFNP